MDRWLKELTAAQSGLAQQEDLMRHAKKVGQPAIYAHHWERAENHRKRIVQLQRKISDVYGTFDGS